MAWATTPWKGGACDDEIYDGPGNDNMVGDQGYAFAKVKVKSGKDVLYGEDGNDTLFPDKDGQRDELYCGKGYDKAMVGSATADKIDYVDDSCEEKEEYTPIVP
jgi:Ca2+-binding RTX toxin-like protein